MTNFEIWFGSVIAFLWPVPISMLVWYKIIRKHHAEVIDSERLGVIIIPIIFLTIIVCVVSGISFISMCGNH